MRRVLAFAAVTALWLAASGSPASASVTLGQLSTANGSCGFGFFPEDFTQLSVSSGNSYQVPETGAITSWSHLAATGSTTVTMKVFRKVAEPNFYRVEAHDTRALAPGIVNTFTTSIPVEAGDLIGLNAPDGSTDCLISVANTPADTFLYQSSSNLADGEGATLTSATGRRLNISAVFAPRNTFTVDKTVLNKKKGTATLTLTLPNPGELTASGNGVNAASAEAQASKAVGAGPAQLLVKAKGKSKKTLNETGKVKLKVAVTYTPNGGDPNTQSVKVKLKKKF